MTIRSIQKVIKVGSSLAVTIPARDARSLEISPGSEVEVTIKPSKPSAAKLAGIEAEYEAFKAQYGETLENLSQR